MTYYSEDRAKNYTREEGLRLYRELKTLLGAEADEAYLTVIETDDLWADVAFMDVVLEAKQ